MKRKFRSALIVSFGLLFFGFTSGLTQARSFIFADEDFAMKAAAAGQKEVELGRLATQQGSSAAVKSFGRKMVADHTSAGNKLKASAMKKGISLPTDLDAEAKAAMDQLSSLTGAAFDRAYMDMMVADHEKAVAEFQTEAASGADPALKAFAAKTLPTLKSHLSMAKATAAKLK